MIIIPMAGLSSRFFKAGYTKPKYMLDAHGISLFDHAVNSFKAYFKTETFYSLFEMFTARPSLSNNASTRSVLPLFMLSYYKKKHEDRLKPYILV